MKKFEQQNNDPEVIKMRELLKGIPRRTKSDGEWVLMRNEVFSRLDELQQAKQSRSRPHGRPIRMWIPSAAVAAAALTVAFTIGGPFNLFEQPEPVASKILTIAGTVTYQSQETGGTISPENLHESPVSPGSVFETGASGSLTLQLDSATAVRLSSDTRLEVVAANSRNLDFRLDRGNLLATVAKRKKGALFRVSTSHAVCRVIGTVFSISVDSPATDNGETLLRVYEGEVSMRNPQTGEFQMVAAGNELAMGVENTGTVVKSSSGGELRELSLLSLALSADSASQSSGILEVRSNPSGVTVASGDRVLGTTPLLASRTTGRYGITLTKKGYDSQNRQVDLAPREHQILDIDMAESVAHRPQSRTVPRREPEPEPEGSDISDKSDMPEDFVDDPSFVEAMIQMTIGEYGKALALLRNLRKSSELSLEDRATIAAKISRCYKGIGDFDRAYKRLEGEYRNADTPRARSQYLWEMANLKANCLGDYRGAMNLLTRYIEKHPEGAWVGEAEQKLEELRFLVEKAGLSKTE